MSFFAKVKSRLPSLQNALLTLLSAGLLVLAFPDFEFWFLAWFALVPFFWAIEREKESRAKTFFLGWLWGTSFFFGTCWWLAFAPTHYGGVPVVVSYFLVFCATAIVGLFPALFAALFSILLKRFGTYAILAAPFLWTAIEFLRFWLTGNNWNAIAYSQAFFTGATRNAEIGGIYLVSFLVVLVSSALVLLLLKREAKSILVSLVALIFVFNFVFEIVRPDFDLGKPIARVIAVQPNVPMSGLSDKQWRQLRERHVQLSEKEVEDLNLQYRTDEEEQKIQTATNSRIVSENAHTFNAPASPRQLTKLPVIIIFPESPMNFRYAKDPEFQAFLKDFAARNDASVLFNSAEPDRETNRYFNSAVMVNERGEKIAQYDKIFLLPFGEYAPVPAPLQALVPTMVGNFSFGREYDLLPFGAARGGVMICFESHFPNLSREYARQGADVLIEMTNDGYLGNTPVLRQHLASAVFRAVETRRPVLRVTNVGVTAFITERGEILDAAEPYTEATRVWAISKSDGVQTFYVRYGDWFAWVCAVVSLVLLGASFRRRKE